MVSRGRARASIHSKDAGRRAKDAKFDMCNLVDWACTGLAGSLRVFWE
jgi:hypothetical protein